jgi:hypothetical protein
VRVFGLTTRSSRALDLYKLRADPYERGAAEQASDASTGREAVTDDEPLRGQPRTSMSPFAAIPNAAVEHGGAGVIRRAPCA